MFDMENLRMIKESAPNNLNIQKCIDTAYLKINDPSYDVIVVSISGGADSDVMLDICTMVDNEHKCQYIFVDTGFEYDATKQHIQELEKKYNIKIEPVHAWKETGYPIPRAVKEFGFPFISKQVSNNIERLQKHNFKWEDKPLLELLQEYCTSPTKEQEEHLNKSREDWINNLSNKDKKIPDTFSCDGKKIHINLVSGGVDVFLHCVGGVMINQHQIQIFHITNGLRNF